jgi:hypothetical protein
MSTTAPRTATTLPVSRSDVVPVTAADARKLERGMTSIPSLPVQLCQVTFK